MARKVKPMMALILVLLALSGCATPAATKMVAQYEVMGKAIKQVHDSGIRLCETEKILSEQDCDRLKKIYNDTRRVYLVTGDTLAFAIQANGTDFSDPANQQVQLLTKAFSDLTLQWLRLVTEFGLIKEGQK